MVRPLGSLSILLMSVCGPSNLTGFADMQSETMRRLPPQGSPPHLPSTRLSLGTPPSELPWLTSSGGMRTSIVQPSSFSHVLIKSAGESVADGTVQDSLDTNSGAGNGQARPRSRSRQRHREREPQRSRKQARDGYTKAGQKICDAFNSTGGCSRQGCTDCHICKSCKQRGHGEHNCRNRSRVRLVLAPPSPPLAGRGGHGGKSGGKRDKGYRQR